MNEIILFSQSDVNMKQIVLLVFVIFLVGKTTGLQCYTCSATEDDSDTHCVDNPGSQEGDITDCDKKYCILVRQDYVDPRGKFASITRNCVDKPTFIDQVVEDSTHRAYYRSCRKDLCNSGSGRTSDTDSAKGSFGDKSTIYCPGIGGNGGFLISVSLPMLVLTIFIQQYLR
ncbi:hypothetical protein JTB14_014949 [Gonioctena quinquepunctata]|nr:hypothetical protein JTB14_014949 [Gonioctena quinquepunctata]